MTPEELAALEARCTARLGELGKRGVSFGGMDTHYIQALLEIHLTPEEVVAAKAAHFSWLSDALDNVEAEIRKALITQGVPNGRR